MRAAGSFQFALWLLALRTSLMWGLTCNTSALTGFLTMFHDSSIARCHACLRPAWLTR